MKHICFLLIPIFLISGELFPIRQRTANNITVGTTIGMTALAAGATKSLLWTACSSLFAYYATSYCLDHYTPKSRFKKAFDKAIKMSHNPFAITSYTKDQQFISDLQDYYRDQYWLISAHEEIDRLFNLGYAALELIDLAKNDCDNDCYLLQECSMLQTKIRSFLVNLTSALRRIKNHTDFTAQRASYNQLILEKQRLAIEREKAHAYYLQARAQQAQAEAQESQAEAVRRSVAYCH